MRVRVVSWNIHKGVGGLDRRYALERIVEFIAHQEPDVVLLQEVAQGWPGAQNEDQVARLHTELGLPHVEFAKEHQFKKGWYGNVILSRFALKDVHHLDLTIDWRKKRGALLACAVVRQKDDAGHLHQRSLLVSNLHLGLAASERSRQLERFFAEAPFASAHHETPWIVAGDLNDLYGGLGPKHLNPRGFLRAGTQRPTFPAFAPLRPLDGIFVRGHAEVIHAGIAQGPHKARASDHLPLVADIQLP